MVPTRIHRKYMDKEINAEVLNIEYSGFLIWTDLVGTSFLSETECNSIISGRLRRDFLLVALIEFDGETKPWIIFWCNCRLFYLSLGGFPDAWRFQWYAWRFRTSYALLSLTLTHLLYSSSNTPTTYTVPYRNPRNAPPDPQREQPGLY